MKILQGTNTFVVTRGRESLVKEKNVKASFLHASADTELSNEALRRGRRQNGGSHVHRIDRLDLGKKFFSEAGAAERRGTQQSQGKT